MEETKAIYGVGGGITGIKESTNTKKPQKLLFYTVRNPKFDLIFYRSYSSRKTSLSGGAYKNVYKSSRYLTILSMQKGTIKSKLCVNH